ncbi:MAG TPA: MraY family glycosyltransferase [Tepidisphaeraceae bacterium]|nr:MraY family glycosyltransferase [Tepidisphaeraceae bacterium]
MTNSLLAIAPDPSNGAVFPTTDHLLEQYIYVFYAAFAVSFLFTPIMRVVANYWGVVDNPDRVRKMHSVPIAYLGGVAVFLGWLSGLAVSQFRKMPIQEPGLTQHVTISFAIVAGASVIIVLGLWDDVFTLRPWMKILGQVVAALFLLAEGFGTRCTGLLFDTYNGWVSVQEAAGGRWALLPHVPEWVTVATSCIAVVFVVVGCCNATNLMDGLDGLCSGVTAIIAFGFLFLSIHLATTSGAMNPNLDTMRVVLAIALLGAVLGFIPYNFNPASIFMGDTGSMFLGFCCAVTMILMAQGQHWKWFLASMVMFALPVLDTALAFTRRWIAGRPLFSADKQHFHHQMVARGLSVKQTVMVSYGLALFFACLGGAIAFMRTRYAIAAYLMVFGYLIVAAYKMGMVHEKPRTVTRRDLSAAADGGATANGADQPVEPSGVIDVVERRVAGIEQGGVAPR